VAGLAVFVTASFLIGVAPTGWWLIAARALQGVGAAVVAPSALSLLTASFPEGEQRSRAVAWYAATAGIGASLGMLVGGAAAQWVSWRAGFFINVPLGIAMALLAPRYLPVTRSQPGRFDTTGAVSATVGVGALVFGIIESAERGWTDPVVVTALAAAAVVLTVLVLHERRADQPIMPLRLFADRRRSGAYAARALYLGAMMGFFFFTTQLMQGVLGFTAFQAGLGFLPMTAVNFGVATVFPRLDRRFGNASTLVTGVALTLTGMAWLAQVDAASPYATGVALPMALIGAGQGLAFAPLTSFGLAGVRSQDAGAASGLVNTAHQLGMGTGLAILVAASADGVDLTIRVGTALTWGTGLLALCLVVVLAVIVPGQRRHTAALRQAATR
jgi:predicted MFS family arabinose efflux permease